MTSTSAPADRETPQDRIVKKVRKLLALTRSSNVHEAGLAAAMAQKLMAKHSIEEALLDTADQDDAISDEVLGTTGSQVARWKIRMAVAVASANGCETYIQHGGHEWTGSRYVPRRASIRIVGRPADSAKARYLYSHLIREIDRLTKHAAHEAGRPGRRWCHSFRLGAVSEIAARLDEALQEAGEELRHAAQAQGRHEIVRVENAIAVIQSRQAQAEAWTRLNLNLRTTSTPRTRLDGAGYEAGRQAGATVNLDAGASLAPGARRAALP